MILETLDTASQDRILAYLDLVIEKNKTLNLTRIDTKEKGITLHIEDSLSCLEELSHSEGEFLDIGTGGGFPGVPLAIATGRHAVLIDSVKKKAVAVDEMVHELGLDEQIEVEGVRSEELALRDGERFDTVVARAVSSLPVLLELAAPLLKVGGELVALRSLDGDEVIEEAKLVAEKLGYEFVSLREFSIDDQYGRSICVFKKVREASISLPRRNGMAQKRPLKA